MGFNDIEFTSGLDSDEDDEKEDEEWLDGENTQLHEVVEVTSSWDWLKRKTRLTMQQCDFWRHKKVTIVQKNHNETECLCQYIDSTNETNECWLPVKVLISMEKGWGIGLDPKVPIVPENSYFITNDGDLFRRCWQECGLQTPPLPIQDYLGKYVRVDSIDHDDNTADILLRGWERCVPLAVLGVTSGVGESGGAAGEGYLQADEPEDDENHIILVN